MSWGKIGARRMVSTLPYDAEVEYLESTGTQWIDTGCNADGGLFWKITVRATQSTTQRMGAIQVSPIIWRNHLSIPETASLLTNIGYNQSLLNNNYRADFGIHIIQIEQSGGIVISKIDGVRDTSTSKSQFDIGGNFFLFARNDKTAISYGSMIVFAAQFFRGDVMIRDFIPVRKGTTGAMYDRRGVGGMNPDGSARTDGLYFNRGTGAFGIGPDKIA